MRFGTLPLDEAEGGILVHSVRAKDRVLKKGRVLARADIDALRAAGLTEVMVARLEQSDVPEDEAATKIARSLAGTGIRVGAAFTGRANLYAIDAGIVVLDRARIDETNLIGEAVTVATLAPYAVVRPGEMIATVKIIPYAAPESVVAAAVVAAGKAPIRVAPFRAKRVALVSTQLPGQKPSLLDKNRAALEQRLAPLGGTLVFESRVPHEAGAVATAIAEGEHSGAELLFVFGASAITDRRDVIPAALEKSGGRVEHLGMPVDPGNLLMLGQLDAATPVLGMPGCVRSPKLNGADWVMERLGARLPVTALDIKRMGAGGLLMEIGTRPLPRAKASQPLCPNPPGQNDD